MVGNSPVVQWLGLSALTAGGPGSIPGPGTKIPQAMRCGKKKKKKKRETVIEGCIVYWKQDMSS